MRHTVSHQNLAQFDRQNYLNLESYRKNGQPVRTPLWFAEERGLIYVYTLAAAYKVKRIRNNPRVRIVASDARGNPKGTWVEGRARILDAAGAEHGHQLLRGKYFLKRFGDLFSRVMNRERVVIAVERV